MAILIYTTVYFSAFNGKRPTLKTEIGGVCFMLQWGGFNLAHWIFSFKYYKIQHAMKHLIATGKVPPRVRKCDSAINYFFITINGLVALANGLSYMLLPFKPQTFYPVYAATKVAVGFLDIVSAGFLIYGIARIWFLSRGRPNDPRLNIPSLLLHFGAFALYIGSTLATYYTYTIYAYSKKNDMPPKRYTIAVTVSNYISTIA
jgi:hypothetical protein